MFDHGIDGRYLLSKLYLDDYCCWVQVISFSMLHMCLEEELISR